MFRFARRQLASSGGDQMVVNTYLGVFALHSRNLFYFFYTKTKDRHKDDMLAEDYLKNKRKFILSRTNKRNLSIILRKTAKQIAHLTYSRANYTTKNKGWEYVDLYNNMEITIDAFYQNILNDYRDWFQYIR